MLRPARSLWKLFPAAAAVLLAAGVLAGCALTEPGAGKTRTFKNAGVFTPPTPAGFERRSFGALEEGKDGRYSPEGTSTYGWDFTSTDLGSDWMGIYLMAEVTDQPAKLDRSEDCYVHYDQPERFEIETGADQSCGYTDSEYGSIRWVGTTSNVKFSISTYVNDDVDAELPASFKPAVELLARALIEQARSGEALQPAKGDLTPFAPEIPAGYELSSGGPETSSYAKNSYEWRFESSDSWLSVTAIIADGPADGAYAAECRVEDVRAMDQERVPFSPDTGADRSCAYTSAASDMPTGSRAKLVKWVGTKDNLTFSISACCAPEEDLTPVVEQMARALIKKAS